MELFITLTKGMGNQRTDFSCLSSRPGVRGLFSASCIEGSSLDTRWTLAGYSGLVVRRLSRGKYIILCESSRSAGFKWDVLLLVTGYLT